MPATAKVVRERRLRRHRSSRKRITGTAERPRFNVFRSSVHIYAQLIDDTRGHTLIAASDREIEAQGGTKSDRARRVGEIAARRAQEKGISTVVFDRGGFIYHGRVQAVAEGARSAGLQF